MTMKGGDQDARLELALTWTRSSFCAHGDCVEVRYADGVVEVRDSKLGKDSPVQRWTPEEWKNLLYAVENLRPHPGVVMFSQTKVCLGVKGRHEFLWFDLYSEWVPFRRGVQTGEFDVDRLKGRSLVAAAGTAGSTSPGSGHEVATGAQPLEGDELPAPVAAESEDVPAGQVSPMVETSAAQSTAGQPGPVSDPAAGAAALRRIGLRLAAFVEAYAGVREAILTIGEPEPVPAARVWALAEEPDRDVYQLSDCECFIWLRQLSSDGPSFDLWHPADDPEHCIPFLDLLIDYGPLTEVIDESAE